MPYDAFISYSSADLPLAQDLYARLTAEGFNVWFDKTRLEPGFDWHREIEQGCEQSRVLLPVLTPRWLKSEWTRYETYGAESIIPLVYEGPRAEVMTPPLERWQPARLDMDQADAAVWARLYAALRRCLAEPLPEKTARLDRLHGRPTDFFVGRDAELVRLHEELHRNPRTVLTQGRVRAITATGGAGKTTLVRHYAEKFWRCYPQILWVDCRNGLELEFAELHDLIYPERAQSGFKVPEKAQSALRALNDQTRRLLILDNAEDEESALAWIPKAGGCHTLITSRYSGWSATVKTLYLFVLEKEPAVTLLQKRSGHPPRGTSWMPARRTPARSWPRFSATCRSPWSRPPPTSASRERSTASAIICANTPVLPRSSWPGASAAATTTPTRWPPPGCPRSSASAQGRGRCCACAPSMPPRRSRSRC
jgi:hypothetical protein